MDCRAVVLFSFSVVLMMLIINEAEGRNKKVVIHVPYKVKKIKHTHTIYKTMHHHHGHHEPLLHEPSHSIHHLSAPPEEHEHFHHMHIHEDQPGGPHLPPVAGIGIPDFLPDAPLDMSDISNVPELLPGRHHSIPLFRRVGEEALEDEDLS